MCTSRRRRRSVERSGDDDGGDASLTPPGTELVQDDKISKGATVSCCREPSLTNVVRVQPVGGLAEVPNGLVAFVEGDPSSGLYCQGAEPCYVFELDLDADGNLDYCLGRIQVHCYCRSGDSWERIGRLAPVGGKFFDTEGTIDHLVASGARTAAPPYLDVEVGKRRFRVEP